MASRHTSVQVHSLHMEGRTAAAQCSRKLHMASTSAQVHSLRMEGRTAAAQCTGMQSGSMTTAARVKLQESERC